MPSFFDSWLPFFYLYGIGGLFFVLGLVIIRRSGAIDMKKRKHRFWFRVLIGGFIYFALIHALGIIAALYW
ncbi:MAG: hypothetical protein JW995_06250 [Melioribacteraceae bacterium]|nr:hypothetical protein [Melioribacteraceae bacterium]